MIHGQRLDILTAVLMFIDQAQQLSDLRHRKPQFSAAADESQSFQVVFLVESMATGAARRVRQQTLPFVVANGFNLAIGSCRQGADADREKFRVFHGKSLVSVVSTGNRLRIPRLVSSFFM